MMSNELKRRSVEYLGKSVTFIKCGSSRNDNVELEAGEWLRSCCKRHTEQSDASEWSLAVTAYSITALKWLKYSAFECLVDTANLQLFVNGHAFQELERHIVWKNVQHPITVKSTVEMEPVQEKFSWRHSLREVSHLDLAFQKTRMHSMWQPKWTCTSP